MTVPLEFEIELTTSEADFMKMTLYAMRDVLNQSLNEVCKKVQEKVKTGLKPFFINTEVYRSLVNGPLDAHFGIPAGEATPRLLDIIDELVNAIEVTPRNIRVTGNGLTGGILIRAIQADFENVMNLPAAIVRNKREDLPWLRWLLTLGDAIIVAGYDIKFGSYTFPPSRSEKAIMIHKKNAVGWRVPIGVSGTLGSNWVTKAVESAISAIQLMLDGAVEEAFEEVLK